MKINEITHELKMHPKRWVVTGVAGFIGSNLLEALLRLNQTVVGVDNFFSGKKANLEEVRRNVSEEQWSRFQFIEGDVRNAEVCRSAVQGVDFVLHQAAVGSVPRSIEDPWTTHDVNVNGTFQVFLAAKAAGVKKVVYASSSSVYGDEPTLPKKESMIGRPLSPYALSKRINEECADIFARSFAMNCVGLRYFNVFGPRQDPSGVYAAVIPKWVKTLLTGGECEIFGDGTQSRDFCYVANVVQANLLAALDPPQVGGTSEVFNVAVHANTSLNELYRILGSLLFPNGHYSKPRFLPPRAGDIPHSHADINLSRSKLGYSPTHTLAQGLEESLRWYKENL